MDQAKVALNAESIIRSILSEIASVHLVGSVQFKTIFDDDQRRYEVIATGWEGDKQVLRTVALLEIQNELIWVQADNTDYGIVDELLNQGIPKSSIVLGFHPPRWRTQPGFAAGE
jgi:XisI protein